MINLIVKLIENNIDSPQVLINLNINNSNPVDGIINKL